MPEEVPPDVVPFEGELFFEEELLSDFDEVVLVVDVDDEELSVDDEVEEPVSD